MKDEELKEIKRKLGNGFPLTSKESWNLLIYLGSLEQSHKK